MAALRPHEKRVRKIGKYATPVLDEAVGLAVPTHGSINRLRKKNNKEIGMDNHKYKLSIEYCTA